MRTFIILLIFFSSVDADAVLLQVDTSGSPEVAIYADYDDGTFETALDVQSLTNSGSTVTADVYYTFSGANGEGSWSTNLGSGSSFYFTFDFESYYSNDSLTATGSLTFTISDVVVNIVAENEESDGTAVTLDWSTALSGFYAPDSSVAGSIDLDTTVLMSYNVSDASSDMTGFSTSDSGEITGYSIGDSFSLDLTLELSTTGDAEIAFSDSGDILSITASAVPEPGSLVLATLGLIVLISRRARRGQERG